MRAPAQVSAAGATTSRPVGADAVTRRRPAIEIPEFYGIERMPDGTWSAFHECGQEVTAPSYRNLEYVTGPAVRIAHEWRTCTR
jgi:hypothetical protein